MLYDIPLTEDKINLQNIDLSFSYLGEKANNAEVI